MKQSDLSVADPEGGGGSGVQSPPPLFGNKNELFLMIFRSAMSCGETLFGTLVFGGPPAFQIPGSAPAYNVCPIWPD